MADLKKQCIYIKFYLKPSKFALVTCEMIKRAFDCNAVGRTQDFWMVCLIQTWETSVEDVSIHVVPPHLTGGGVDWLYSHRRQSTILEMWQVRPVIENNPADSKGGWNVWGMSWICALVTHWWVSAAAAVVSQGLWDEGRNYPNILPRGTTGNETGGALMTPKPNRVPSLGSHLWHPKKIR